jgi:hypothetical protein
MQHETSKSVVLYDPCFADGEGLVLAGFLAGYRGSTRDTYALDLRQFVSWCADQELALFSSPSRHRVLRPHPGGARPGAGHRCPEVVHGGRVLPLRRRRRPAGCLTGRARVPAPSGLRVARCRLGAKRGRRPAGGRWARTGRRARPHVPLGAQRPAGLRSDRRQYRSPRPRAWTPDSDHSAQRRQGRHHSSRASHRQGHRSNDRRARPGTDLHRARHSRPDRHGAARIVRRVARRAGIASRSGRTPCATP